MKTKKAKTVEVKFIRTINFVPHYRCPACKTYFEGGNIDTETVRFRCSHCGQELITKFNGKTL